MLGSDATELRDRIHEPPPVAQFLPMDWTGTDAGHAMGKKTLKIGSTVCACVLVALVVAMWTGRNTPPTNSSPAVPGPRSWPNEPAGFRPVTDQPWNPPPALGWSLAWGQTAV